MALRNSTLSEENCRPKRYLRSKPSIEYSNKDKYDDDDDDNDNVNKENNKLIDDLFNDQPKYAEKPISHSVLGKSSITIYKINKIEKNINKQVNKENIDVKRERKRACVDRTYEKIQNISSYLEYSTPKKKIKSVYDFDYDDEELSDNELNFLIQRGNKKRTQAKNRTPKPSRTKQNEMDRIREIEEREIREASREYEQIKNYKLIVETVQNSE